MSNRRQFLAAASAVGFAALAAGVPADASMRRRRNPSLTFYGAVGRVSGSCPLLEASRGLYLIECGLFMSDAPDRDVSNAAFPFDPKEVQAVFLTHAHTEHNGRLPLLVKQGFRGPINRRLSKSGVDCCYTDSGHILGSAMIEIWADGRKILFSGDMGPDGAPLLCDPARHRDADAVLFENAYRAVRGAAADYAAFGRRVRVVE